MGVLQRKKDGTEVISVRVPRAINEKLIDLRRRARWLERGDPAGATRRTLGARRTSPLDD